jgi:hypothetical protein
MYFVHLIVLKVTIYISFHGITSAEEKLNRLRLAPARMKLKFSDDDQCVIFGETTSGLIEGTSQQYPECSTRS